MSAAFRSHELRRLVTARATAAVLCTAISAATVASHAAGGASGIGMGGAPSTPSAGIVAARSPAFVRLGVAPVPPRGARDLGALPGAHRIVLTFVLAPRSPLRLAQLTRAVSDPTSPLYHHYLSRGEFDRQFGPTASTIRATKAALADHGLAPEGTGPDGLSVRVVTTVGDAERALRTRIERYALRGGADVAVNDAPPAIPRSIAAHVEAIIGLDTSSVAAPLGLSRPRRGLRAAIVPNVAASEGPTPTPECAPVARAAGYTADQLAGAYGYTGVYASGDLGAGASIGLIEFSPILDGDIATYASCYGLAFPSISVVAVDGGPTTDDASNVVEAELDLEDLVGLAPAAHFVVYEGSDVGGDVSGTAAYDAYATAVNQDAVQVLSTSWGGCEQSVGTGAATAEEVLFEQAALQGQTVVAAAGDGGSEDCFGTIAGAGGMALAVDDPASQPYVTAVGGTTLDIGGSPVESVWNTTLHDSSPGAGGGGVSDLWAMPDYQAHAARALRVASASSACGPRVAAMQAHSPVVGAAVPGGACRELPDVAANAGAPYAIYCTVGEPTDCATGGWTGLGGTSAAAPTWAALFALADASTACAAAGPVGFANPALYAIASSDYGHAFGDVVVGSNDLTGTNPGHFDAGPGFDLASGLGTPLASGAGGGGLVADLCGAAGRAASAGALPLPSVAAVAPRAIRARAGVHVTITGTNLSGATAVRFGGAAALSFTVRSRTTIDAVAPGGAGLVHVTVTTRAGRSARVPADVFAYLVRPILYRVAPPRGPARGRTVVLVGEHLDGAVAVLFGTRPASSFAVRSPRRIVAVAPPGDGTVVVTVRTRAGTSVRRGSDRFTYVGRP